ncbi:MAG: deoxynucleoside kinase [Burkholderiales bacterium]
MELAKLRHMVVEGPIGVGKTTLARRLSEKLRADLLLEAPEQNPFLEKFYRDSRRYALQTQLFFLFQRIEQLRDLAQADLFARPVVSDFLLEKDPLFAQLTLNDDELGLYQKIYSSLSPQAATPDLVIFLMASPDTLIERVAWRGIASEAAISEDYLRALCHSYTELIHDYDDAPQLVINTEHLNPIDSEEDFSLLMQRIVSMRGKREYFNRAE